MKYKYPVATTKVEFVKPYVDDNGIWIPSVTNPRCHEMLISKELFVEAFNKWIVGEKKPIPYDWDDCEWENDD